VGTPQPVGFSATYFSFAACTDRGTAASLWTLPGAYCSRVVFVDVSTDAKPDIYAANDTGDNYPYMNCGAARGSLSKRSARPRARPATTAGSRTGVWESARATRFVKGGGNYGSASDPQLHSGLGADTGIEKGTPYWPSGQSQGSRGRNRARTGRSPTARRIRSASE